MVNAVQMEVANAVTSSSPEVSPGLADSVFSVSLHQALEGITGHAQPECDSAQDQESETGENETSAPLIASPFGAIPLLLSPDGTPPRLAEGQTPASEPVAGIVMVPPLVSPGAHTQPSSEWVCNLASSQATGETRGGTGFEQAPSAAAPSGLAVGSTNPAPAPAADERIPFAQAIRVVGPVPASLSGTEERGDSRLEVPPEAPSEVLSENSRSRLECGTDIAKNLPADGSPFGLGPLASDCWPSGAREEPMPEADGARSLQPGHAASTGRPKQELRLGASVSPNPSTMSPEVPPTHREPSRSGTTAAATQRGIQHLAVAVIRDTTETPNGLGEQLAAASSAASQWTHATPQAKRDDDAPSAEGPVHATGEPASTPPVPDGLPSLHGPTEVQIQPCETISAPPAPASKNEELRTDTPKPTGSNFLPPDRAEPPWPHAADLVRSARMLEKVAQSEMHIGLRTAAFGSVEVHTVIRQAQVDIAIGSEKGDLRTWLTSEMPVLEASLRQHHLKLEDVRLLETCFSNPMGFSAGADSHPRSFHPPTSSRHEAFTLDETTELTPSVDTPGKTNQGLSVHA